MKPSAALVQRTPPSTAGLPGWPRWKLARNGRWCTVSGRHLTPFRARVAGRLAAFSTLALLILPGYLYWGFNVPDLVYDIVTVGARTAQKMIAFELTPAGRKWAYVGLYVLCVLLFGVWERPFLWLYGTLLTTRTTIRFTADRITFHRRRFFGLFPRRYPRLPSLSTAFSQTPHPNLPWLEAKARNPKWGPRLLAFYQQIRFVHMEYGQSLVEVGRFVSPSWAESFVVVCQFAATFPLRRASDDETAGGSIVDEGEI